MESETKRASRRLLAVTEEELNRIVLDIHDGPVQYLFAALSLLTRLQHQVDSQLSKDEEASKTLAKVSQLVEESLHEIKSFLGTFRPPEFHRRTLSSLVQGIVIQHEEWTGHSVDLTIETLPSDIPLPSKIALYRILQEALSNAHRHSGTKQQWVKLYSEDDIIVLDIMDKGSGFRPPLLEGPNGTEREEHIGLRGMRDRVKLVGGEFQLISNPGEGTHIVVRMPAYERGNKQWPTTTFE
jgi:signal transduction histidine kinase